VSTSFRVLVLDLRDLQLLRTCLLQVPGRPFAVTGCSDVESALAAVAGRHPDAIVMEMHLGSDSGASVLRTLRAMHCRSPVVMVGRGADAQAAVDALRAGASDYVAKEALSPARLQRALQAAIDRSQMEQRLLRHRELVEAEHRELQRRHEELQADLDELTGEFAAVLAAVRAFLATIAPDHALTPAQRQLLREALDGCERARACARGAAPVRPGP
jgi:DNA-binding response OmpR family regulator